ncbi:Protein 5NUC [Frankliniella fusca]|uniref:Structure-specific endonuclease subunit SLX1 homolog n=1 Tax=Frankliniella fusca TaxID=407009 RepID=A0AAE1H3F8_9NEOP|nr:Protein 5NUC [Frankliniella fusca]
MTTTLPLLLLLLLAQLIAGGTSTTSTDRRGRAQQGLELLVIHTNDMHSRFEQTNSLSGQCTAVDESRGRCYGGYARVATQIRRAREEAAAAGGPPVLVLNAGDTYQGSIYFNVFKWRMAANLTNLLGFDAMALGNHEFDEGEEGLLPFLQAVRAPTVAANLDLGSAPALRPLVRPSLVLDVQGTKVAVIGYITPETATLGKPGQVRFTDEIPALTAEATRLHRDGVGIIIALGHSGYPVDKAIAERVPYIDLVVGGHSHSFLYTGEKPDIDDPVGQYPTFVRQASGREVPVVQAYAYTKYLGRLKIRFDADGEIASRADVQGHPVLLDSTTPEDPEVQREVAAWRRQLGDVVTRPIGRTLTFLDGKCRSKECNLGNLVADSFVYYRARQYQGPGWTDAPIGIQNGGNIRTSISSDGNGTLTLQNTMEACPFENFLVVVYLPGSVLLEMLEHSVFGYDPTGQHEKGGFLQYSGIRVTYDLSAPYGQRVVSAWARCGNCSVPRYSPVDKKAVYGVITTDFTVNGGDGYSMLSTAPTGLLADITPYTAMAEYIRSLGVVYPGLEGRIQFAQRDAASAATSMHTISNSKNILKLVVIVMSLSFVRCNMGRKAKALTGDLVESFYGVYLLYCMNPRFKGRTYIGFTVDPNRRIEQHNLGKEKGGAWRTHNKGPWNMVLTIHGFPNEISALRFEWAWQHPQRSRRLRHVSAKKSKESAYDYALRVVSEMLSVGPWCRLPLTIRWLVPEFEKQFAATPPLHMALCYGPVISKKITPKDKQKESDIESEDVPITLCKLCKMPCTEGDIIKCLSNSCCMEAHAICLAKVFLENDQDHLLPVVGSCPSCDNVMLWGDLIRKKKGCYQNLGNQEDVCSLSDYETDVF